MGSSKNRLRERKMSRPNGMASPLSDLSAAFANPKGHFVKASLCDWRKSKRDICRRLPTGSLIDSLSEKTVVRLPALPVPKEHLWCRQALTTTKINF